MKLRVVHLAGTRTGAIDEISAAQILLGRGPMCHVRFDGTRDDRVSTQHVMITVRGNELIVSDLGSRNGTIVNGKHVAGAVLVPARNAIIELGSGGPRVTIEVVPEAAPTPPAPAPADEPADEGSPRIKATAVSEQGPRSENQDFFHGDPPLVIVADGCGGHLGGRTASHMAVETLLSCLEDHATASEALALPGERRRAFREHQLAAWFRLANRRVHHRATTDPTLHGMGTTLTAVWAVDDKLVVANAGDSRLYQVRDRKITQLTEDDSFVGQLERDGLITREEAATHPDRNVLLRSIGMKPAVEAQTQTVAPLPGDVYLLCSDGVYGPVDEETMLETISSTEKLPVAAKRLVDEALRRGGNDNATAVLFRVV